LRFDRKLIKLAAPAATPAKTFKGIHGSSASSDRRERWFFIQLGYPRGLHDGPDWGIKSGSHRKAERRLWLPKRSAAADNLAVQTFGSGS